MIIIRFAARGLTEATAARASTSSPNEHQSPKVKWSRGALNACSKNSRAFARSGSRSQLMFTSHTIARSSGALAWRLRSSTVEHIPVRQDDKPSPLTNVFRSDPALDNLPQSKVNLSRCGVFGTHVSISYRHRLLQDGAASSRSKKVSHSYRRATQISLPR